MREDPSKGVVVEGLKTFRVETYADVERLLEEGLANRTVGSTAMNATSSRSHSCFTLDIIQKTAKSRLTLIDLAGSENIKSAETVGERMKEGININKSLSCLGACIGALSKLAAKKDKAAAEMEDAIAALPEKAAVKKGPAGRGRAARGTVAKGGPASKGPKKKKGLLKPESHVPFRDSVLTLLLRDTLCGNSRTVVLAALSPAAVNFHDTLSTLRFAMSAKSVKTRAVSNENPVQKLIKGLQSEVAQLRAQIAAGGGAGGGSGGGGGDGGAAAGASKAEAKLAKKAAKEAERKYAKMQATLVAQIEAVKQEMAESDQNMHSLRTKTGGLGAYMGSRGGGGGAMKPTPTPTSVFNTSEDALAGADKNGDGGGGDGGGNDGGQLVYLSDDPMLSQRIRITLSLSTTLTIGRSDATDKSEPFLALNGLGIAADSCRVVCSADGKVRFHSLIHAFTRPLSSRLPTLVLVAPRLTSVRRLTPHTPHTPSSSRRCWSTALAIGARSTSTVNELWRPTLPIALAAVTSSAVIGSCWATARTSSRSCAPATAGTGAGTAEAAA